MEKRIPRRRFKEFIGSGDWEEKKLGDISTEILAGGDIDKLKIKNKGVYPVIANSLVNSGVIGYYDEIFRVKAPALTITGRGDVGVSIARHINFTPVVRLISIKSYMNVEFLEKCINNIKILNESTGVPQLTVPKVKNIEVIIPSLAEQEKIGDFFQKLDRLIEINKDKLDKLKASKSAYLTEMFPGEGEDRPRRRFQGFTAPWEEKKLGEVADIISGGTPSTNKPEYWNGQIDWYSPTEIGKNIYASGSKKKITKLGLEKSSAKILPADRTVLFTSRAGIGDMAILKRTGTTNQGFQSLVLDDDTNVYFLYSMGSIIKKCALEIASGSTFLEISGKKLAQINITIPSLAEQEKIGDFFKKLDEQIGLQEEKLEKLEKMKKAYLAEMFV